MPERFKGYEAGEIIDRRFPVSLRRRRSGGAPERLPATAGGGPLRGGELAGAQGRQPLLGELVITAPRDGRVRWGCAATAG